MNEIDQLTEAIMEKHNFIVRGTLAEDDEYTVNVDFAGRKQATYRVVVDEEGEIYGVTYNSSIMLPEQEEFIPLDRTLVRLYILCEIYRQCRHLELPMEIVRFYSPEGDKVEFMELLDVPLTDEEIEIEKVLDQCLSGILNEDVDIEEMYDALEKDCLLNNFNILKSTLV